jgi:hypothetical protein
MDDVKDIRLQNLIVIADEFKRDEHLNDKQFAAKIGMKPSFFSQLKKQVKPIGDSVARSIERNLALEYGTLDRLKSERKEAREDSRMDAQPASDVLAVAYAIDALPAGLRNTVKNLIFQMSSTCHRETDINDVQPFSIIKDVSRAGNEQNSQIYK